MPRRMSIHDLYARIFRLWRARRFALFVRTLQPRLTDHLLDVGGYPWGWAEVPRLVARIDTLNLAPVPWQPVVPPANEIQVLVGDGRRLPFADGTYDIVYSNSVIEHVGSYADQQAFAAELRRVGRALWCQTPAREFFLEPHYLAPFVHWLPRPLQKRLVRWLTPWGWLTRPSPAEVTRTVEEIRLLSLAEMRALFPDCEILCERFLGLATKSYIAVRRNADRPPAERCVAP